MAATKTPKCTDNENITEVMSLKLKKSISEECIEDVIIEDTCTVESVAQNSSDNCKDELLYIENWKGLSFKKCKKRTA